MALSGATPGIHYFGPGGAGVAYPQPPAQPPQAGLPLPAPGQPVSGAAQGIQNAGRNPLVTALLAAASGQPEGFAQTLHGLGDNEQGARLWEMRHPGVMGSPGHPGEGHVPGWVLQAQTQAAHQAVGGGQPSLANLLAAAAAAHPQMGGTPRRMRPGGGAQLPPQANQYPQLHRAAG